jgi:hypothetical protein
MLEPQQFTNSPANSTGSLNSGWQLCTATYYYSPLDYFSKIASIQLNCPVTLHSTHCTENTVPHCCIAEDTKTRNVCEAVTQQRLLYGCLFRMMPSTSFTSQYWVVFFTIRLLNISAPCLPCFVRKSMPWRCEGK